MKKALIFSFVLGLISLQGCSSTSNAPTTTTATCTLHNNCSGGTPVCNTTTGKCVAESATACLPNGGTYCATIAPGMTCNAAGNACACGTTAACTAGQQCVITAPATTLACATFPRLAFVTANSYSPGAAYKKGTTTGPLGSTQFASLADANTVCNDEYATYSTATVGSAARNLAKRSFIAVLASNGNSMWSNTYPFAKNPRPIYSITNPATFNNTTTSAAGLTQISNPLPTTATSSCTTTAPTNTGTSFVGFDCIGNGTIAYLPPISGLGAVQPFVFWTGAITPTVTGIAFDKGDVSGFFTAGTATSTCTNYALSTTANSDGYHSPGFAGTRNPSTTDVSPTWTYFTANGASLYCAQVLAPILCLEQD